MATDTAIDRVSSIKQQQQQPQDTLRIFLACYEIILKSVLNSKTKWLFSNFTTDNEVHFDDIHKKERKKILKVERMKKKFWISLKKMFSWFRATIVI